MSQENVELVRRTYEVINAIGRTDSQFVDPEELAPDLWAAMSRENVRKLALRIRAG
jgi:hypothetical protein